VSTENRPLDVVEGKLEDSLPIVIDMDKTRGTMQVIAFIEDSDVIKKILKHLRL
jgi:hypothetical protein